ncbi:MAG: hypothetical protein BWY72_01761 [Bacteroidetes bacterium ADurb.Bin416]|nr:MAG: hypothetical protein BWY72_01761 [Bacteroidetes bacterium ADurb.Bin416]
MFCKFYTYILFGIISTTISTTTTLFTRRNKFNCAIRTTRTSYNNSHYIIAIARANWIIRIQTTSQRIPRKTNTSICFTATNLFIGITHISTITNITKSKIQPSQVQITPSITIKTTVGLSFDVMHFNPAIPTAEFCIRPQGATTATLVNRTNPCPTLDLVYCSALNNFGAVTIIGCPTNTSWIQFRRELNPAQIQAPGITCQISILVNRDRVI